MVSEELSKGFVKVKYWQDLAIQRIEDSMMRVLEKAYVGTLWTR